ncbi:hypothetical protein J5277_13560 [Rhizobium sp. 16-449-1b]|uniref:hypothetical protein n=1 Tax=Rhizobium sp. 16-449-1b TaxID=2819989 RepID=UPI001ADB7CE8|nr:hypothetical protein [Rhizobium sp. 16-449-1b]MBO9195132.1 hypothetical protein [Rhizobium sp. 16-449-1b]
MADETSMSPTVETPPAEAPAASKEKKTRAPRKPKVAAEAAVGASVSTAAKKTRGPGKKKAAATEAAVSAPVVKTPAAAAKAQPAKREPRKAETAPAVIDGFAELLKLEEENQKLRKALSEKLRAENAELRKRLGTA